MGMDVNDVVGHLFRQESGKLASSLARAFRLSKLDVVEDIVQDTLLAALTDWSFRGVPENPTAWLHRVAKNKAVDFIRKRNRESRDTVELLPGLRAASQSLEIERDLLTWGENQSSIADSQLRMMFACCHPGIPVESQIALTLKTLCGFSVREIASAFLTEESTIEKRLGRARKFFRDQHVELEVPSKREIQTRLSAVLHSLYLMFNEGYKRTESDGLVDRDLCLEALRLALLISDQLTVRSPESLALISMMNFHAARFDTRTNAQGEIVLLSEQDRSSWNRDLIERGTRYLERSEPDIHSSIFHIEAAIQSIHMAASSFEATDWAAILGLYKRLYAANPNPIVAMHMSVSLGSVHGAEAAIELLRQNPVHGHYLYYALLADAEEKAGRRKDAIASLGRAVALTKNAKEKVLLEARLRRLTTEALAVRSA